MYWYTRRGAERINSGALMADAWHHRSDSLSSAGAFLGILGARLGYPVLDPDVYKRQSLALKIEDRNKLFEPGYLPCEIGYCVMEDGSAYLANRTEMPGVTPEMFEWWFAWHLSLIHI